MPAPDLTGQRFGKLVVLARAGRDANRRPTWQCRCDCGRSCVARGGNLTSGDVQSCGCGKAWRKGRRFGFVAALDALPPLALTPPPPTPGRPRPAVTLPTFAPPDEKLLAEAARERDQRRQAVRDRHGTGLAQWAGLYLARINPSRSTVKGWRLALSWLGEFVGRLPTLDDLDRIDAAADWLLSRGRHPASVAVTRRRLAALRRFAVGAGAVEVAG